MDNINMPTEILDVAEARRRLPDVRRYVERVMAITREVRELQENARGAGTPELDSRVAILDERFRRALKAMNELGAYLKDPAVGLIDFYSWMDGEMVFLCWKHGEDDIHWWHGIDDGFAGRKPLPE